MSTERIMALCASGQRQLYNEQIKTNSLAKFNLYFTDLYVVTGKYMRCALPDCEAECVNGHRTGDYTWVGKWEGV